MFTSRFVGHFHKIRKTEFESEIHCMLGDFIFVIGLMVQLMFYVAITRKSIANAERFMVHTVMTT